MSSETTSPKCRICYTIYTVLSNFSCSYTHLKSASPFEAELQLNLRKLTIPVMDKKQKTVFTEIF